MTQHHLFLTQGKLWANSLKTSLDSATPRVQLFFAANCLKFLGIICAGIASFFNFQPLALGTSLGLILWLSLMIAIAIPRAPLSVCQRWLKPAYKTSLAILVIAMSLHIVVASTVMIWKTVDSDSLPSIAHGVTAPFATLSDASRLTMQAAENILAGKNPYEHANIVTASAASMEAHTKLTPLRTGAFADDFPYPTQDEIKNAWDAAVTNPDITPSEFESKFNYPAGSFLLLTPFTMLGINDIRLILIVLIMPALIYAMRKVAPRQRWYLALGILLSYELWNLIFTFDTKLLCLPFMLVGWLIAPRRPWLSAVLIGIAVATKQTAWFLLPFYFIFIWQTAGLRPALRSGMVIVAVFFIANAPFIIADPPLWLSSVMAPMTDPMFPLGHGVISFVTSGLIHLDSPLIFTVLEVAAFAGCLIWYLRHARRCPHSGLILALVPLFFAWRSILSYFCFVDIILLSTILVQESQQPVQHLATTLVEQPVINNASLM